MSDLLFLLFVIGLNLFLGVLVFLRNRKSNINIIFFSFILAVIFWMLSNYFVDQSSTEDGAIFWTRMTFIGSYFIPVFLLHFTILFPLHRKISTIKTYLIYIPAVLLTVFTFTSLVIKGVEDINIHPIVPVFGELYYFFVIYFILYIILSFYFLINSYKNSLGVQKIRVKYLFFGLLIAVIFGMTTNLLLPVFGYSQFSNYGSIATMFFFVFTAYAIIKHQLMDIRLIILRTITYSLVVLLISTTVVGLTLLLPQALDIDTTSRTIIAVLVSIFIVIILEPLKRTLAKATDKLFFKAQVDYQKLLSELSQIINREIDLDILLYSMSRKLEQTVKIKNVSIYLAGATGGAYYKRHGRIDKKTGKKLAFGELHEFEDADKQDLKNKIHHNNPLIEYMRRSQDIIVLEGLERKIEDTQDVKERKELESSKEAMEKLDATVIAPITVGNSLNAIAIFGHKLSGDTYSSEDIDLMKLIGPQLASALEKSRLYEEAQRFTERLKKEVAVATEDLRDTNLQMQERNRFLAALQKITTLITRTLDFGKVTQAIADGIYTELGYIGGIVLFLGKDRKKLFADAVTQTPITKKVLKLLPKPLTEYWGDASQAFNRTFKSIESGEVQIGTKLTDFISPAVPEDIVEQIQKILKVKSVISVPIYSEQEVVGAIVFMLAEEPGTFKQTDISMMKALANQSGIVSRNIELYKRLEESNKHLQQLDQAKSEFVSITSHQLRTPMTGIKGYLSMVLEGDFGKISADQRKVLSGLLDESERMIRLINLFLDVTKIESGKLELNPRPLQMEEVVDRVMGVVKKFAEEKKLTLTYKHPKKPLPVIEADKDKLGDIVMNLIDNAIKYTDKGSVKVSTVVEDDHILFSVKDTGRGIESEEAKKLFTKFVRGFGIAQVNPDGSGLGLYVARRLTEAHGGKIWVESKGLGHGSSFHVQIPITKKKEEK